MRDRLTLTPVAVAERLALWRILVAGFVTIYVAVRSPVFLGLRDRPPAEWDGVGPWAWLDRAPMDPVLVVLVGIVVVTGAMVAAGVWHRVIGPVFGVATLLLLAARSSYGQILWFEPLIALHALVVAFAPAADAWRLGDWSAGDDEPAMRYGHPLRLAAVLTIATYVLAGVAKLRIGGLEWLRGDTLGNHIAFSATRLEVFGERTPFLADAALALGPALTVGAVVVVAVELGAPIALLGDRWRTGWIVAVLAMHLGVAATMFIVFPYHVTGIALLPLFDARPSRWRRWPG